MYKRTIFAAVTVIFVGCASAQTASQPATKTAQVAPGVAWENFVVAKGPRNYNILRVNVADPEITLEMESGKNALFRGEKVLQTVQREEKEDDGHVVAGVNANFWRYKPRNFSPIGLLVADGMIYTMPYKNWPVFLFGKSEKMYIGNATMDVTIGSGKSKLKVEELNPSVPDDDAVTLFTPPYGEGVGPIKGKRYLLAMAGSEFLPNQPVTVKVTEVSAKTTTPLSANNLILQIPSDEAQQARSAIKDRQNARLLAKIPQLDDVIASACSGSPVLVRNGKVDIGAGEGGHAGDFVTKRHPRTAIGITKDQKNVFLVTIDGRQPQISIGANLQELAEFMTKLGCWTAMNLDGGGSTSMVVGDKVVNHPSDLQGPRTVATSLLVVETENARAATQPAQAGQ